MTATVAVRDLAAFVHRRGDIHFRYTGSATAAEGIGAQRRAQPRREGYRRELPVAATVARNGVALRIGGRIDGIDEAARVIEEYKTTRSEVAGLHAHIGHLHLAQLKLYAALLNAMGEATRREAWRLCLSSTCIRTTEPQRNSKRHIGGTTWRSFSRTRWRPTPLGWLALRCASSAAMRV